MMTSVPVFAGAQMGSRLLARIRREGFDSRFVQVPAADVSETALRLWLTPNLAEESNAASLIAAIMVCMLLCFMD